MTLTYPIRSTARLASSVAGVLAISIACLLGLPVPSAGQPFAVVPNSPASRPPPDSALSTDDLRFIDEVALTETMEIQAAEMALELSGDPTILAYARLMLKDHRALAADLDRVARAEGITPDTRLPEAPEIARLRHLKGAEFDRVYLQVVAVDAHRQAVTLFQRQASQGTSPKLRAFAMRNMPMLKQHLERATNLAARMTATS
ncbi:DUF4142 domain-containing protein [Cupriavidus sp. D39]|uniref:DUF4142 domain-containing protein n=1 Tax=Cupriavidus sp. D39 TaxID=2997877 RepID=UPI00226E29F2|nr:DUF4142 domain-containing protein [Cupriavidus sp. D39]MCY0853292.1 DUF4142 domain-containing protein [Cupriavidus sp. D39]